MAHITGSPSLLLSTDEFPATCSDVSGGLLLYLLLFLLPLLLFLLFFLFLLLPLFMFLLLLLVLAVD
jgi:hypothetical protein